jgi:large subunit ribosomal protein L13
VADTPNKTWQAKPDEVERAWFVVDAADQVLGRLATRVAMVLRGRHKPVYTPHVDTGDFVVVVNAGQVALTGTKPDSKFYYAYSGRKGGLKKAPAGEVRAHDPERMIREAVRGMLPKNRLARHQLSKLKVYAGATHPHVAQQPQPLPNVW